MKKIKIALVGNTNAGKTTFLNIIGGFSQETSNYPGTTVEIFTAKIKYQNIQYEVTDLPGTYSLTPFSDEEKVAREILQKEKFDLVIQVIEPAFKKRSLTFTLELMELNLPLFLVINNKNDSWQQADCFLGQVKQKLNISGIVVNALNKDTKNKFFEAILNYDFKSVDYQTILYAIHKNLCKEVKNLEAEIKTSNLWEIFKILEEDTELLEKYSSKLKKIEETLKVQDKDYGLEVKNNRYDFIERYLIQHFHRRHHHRFHSQHNSWHRHFYQKCPHSFTDILDNILLNKWLGIPIFLFFMWLMFEATFTLGAIPMDLIDSGFGFLQDKLTIILPPSLLSSVLIDGVIGGVGATLVFLPPIMLLFFFLSLLQQSGYLARTAYLLDSLMQRMGLSGKAFVPLLMGFGCNAPAIMATRTLGSRKERIITAMMIPFMSCGAKLPVYTLFISAFFATKYQGTILFGLYCLGVLISLLIGIFFNKFLKEKECPLLLELPAYSLPRLKNIWQSVWRPTKEFLYKAGKVILPLSIILWFLFSFPQVNNENVFITESYAAQIGKVVEPIFKPLGFDWKISTGLIAGLGAKEVFVSTFGTLYSLAEGNETGLILKLQNDPIFSTLTVISLLIFVLIYTPCIAVIAILKQEFGSKWAMAGVLYPTLLAWLLSFLVYQIGLIIF